MLWDVFCRVIDNHGDLGLCWRLAAALAERGEAVRLWVDDASALAWMAPRGVAGVEVIGGREAFEPIVPRESGDVVIEAFGCDPPEAFIIKMQRERPPLWVNLEYLSAEGYVERSHGLPSPQTSGPGRGLVKWFFFPGFTERTGGLIREPDLNARQRAFNRDDWLAAHGVQPAAGERVVSLFCYDNPALPALIRSLAAQPTLLLTTPGPATDQANPCGLLRTVALPWLTQTEYDELLWACDLNFVRGEDSFVRAQWAAALRGAPFVWQAYPQHDGAHALKVNAFLDRFLAAADASLAAAMRGVWRGWNGLTPWRSDALDEADAAGWRTLAEAWQSQLATGPELIEQLIGFVTTRR